MNRRRLVDRYTGSFLGTHAGDLTQIPQRCDPGIGGCHQHPELEATEEQMVKTISDATKISLETAVKLHKLDHGS